MPLFLSVDVYSPNELEALRHERTPYGRLKLTFTYRP